MSTIAVTIGTKTILLMSVTKSAAAYEISRCFEGNLTLMTFTARTILLKKQTNKHSDKARTEAAM
jgi:hypothetical protein